jgi:hypothetical protein
MRRAVRPFIREYKNRSSRSIPKEMIESASTATDRGSMASDSAAPVHQNAKSWATFDAAHAIFDAGEKHPAALRDESSPKMATGRILPCLLQQFNHADGQTEREKRTRKRVMHVKASAGSTPEKKRGAASDFPTLPKEGDGEMRRSSRPSFLEAKKRAQTEKLGPGQKWKRRLAIYAR